MNEYPSYRFMQDAKVALPKGWVKLGSAMIDEFQNAEEQGLLPDDFRVLAVCEEFGRLRVPCLSAPRLINNLLAGFKSQAQMTCQDCGYYPAYLSRRGAWLRTLCCFCKDRQGYQRT